MRQNGESKGKNSSKKLEDIKLKKGEDIGVIALN